MRHLRTAFRVVVVFLLAAVARAQVRENPNPPASIDVRSPDGKQVLTIDYVKAAISLHDDGGTVRWSAELKSEDREPWTDYFVSNGGWVLRMSNRDRVTIREPEHGETVYIVSLLDEFSRHGWSRYVKQGTDGPPRWNTHSLWGFREVQGKECFVVRPWWGDHVIIDLKGKQRIDDVEEAHDEIVKQESEVVLRELREVAALPQPSTLAPDEGSKVRYRARRAAHLAGLMKLSEAIDSLRVLEKWSNTDLHNAAAIDAQGSTGFDPLKYDTDALRQAVQLSLRRLGVSPTEPGPVIALRFHPDREGEARTERVSFPRPDLPRPVGGKSLRKGLTLEEVGALLGNADAVTNGAWEWDIESGAAGTMRVTWRDGAVASLERIPPRWHSGNVRDVGLVE